MVNSSLLGGSYGFNATLFLILQLVGASLIVAFNLILVFMTVLSFYAHYQPPLESYGIYNTAVERTKIRTTRVAALRASQIQSKQSKPVKKVIHDALFHSNFMRNISNKPFLDVIKYCEKQLLTIHSPS